MFETILFILALFYAFQILAFAVAAFAARYPHRSGFLPTVDVIIAARNEEQRIRACLDSIARLSYPKDRLRVVVVNDRSTDGTEAIVREYSMRHPWITVLTAAPASGHLQGKTNAVTQGIEATEGEFILFTDADCEVPADWVQQTVQYYADDAIGIVAGFTSLSGRRIFERMQALDWFVLFSAAAATIRLGFPVTAVGTNLSVRRRAYEKVGGYRKIPFSVTEDYALVHAVTGTGGFKARFPLNPGALVVSHPCADWRELYRQKKRWFAGGKGMDIRNLAVFAIDYALNAALFVGLFVSPASLLLPLALKLGADLLMTIPSLSAFRRWDALAAYPLFAVYYFVYILLFPPVVVITGGVVWKEREFSRADQKTRVPL